MKDTKICVIGLGYVGLPLALNLAKSFDKVVGFDINEKKVNAFKNGIDAISENFCISYAVKPQNINSIAIFITKSTTVEPTNIFIIDTTIPTIKPAIFSLSLYNNILPLHFLTSSNVFSKYFSLYSSPTML